MQYTRRRTGGIYPYICSVYLEEYTPNYVQYTWRTKILNMRCIPEKLEEYTPDYALYTWKTGGIYSWLCSVHLKIWRNKLLTMLCITEEREEYTPDYALNTWRTGGIYSAYLKNWRNILQTMLCIPEKLEEYTPDYALYTWRTGGIYSWLCSVYLENGRNILLIMLCIPGDLEEYIPDYALYTWRTGGIYSWLCSVSSSSTYKVSSYLKRHVSIISTLKSNLKSFFPDLIKKWCLWMLLLKEGTYYRYITTSHSKLNRQKKTWVLLFCKF